MATKNKVASEPVADSAPRLSDADLGRAMRLVKDADSVELKVTIPGGAHRATVQGLPIDPVEAQPRQVFFFDTPDLALNAAGVVVRTRRTQGGRGDTVVKLRPVVPAELPKELRRRADFNVEVDILPGGFVCSASFKGRATGDEVRDAAQGRLALRKVFSSAQRAFYAQHAPEGVRLQDLLVLGPTFLLKSRFTVPSGGRKAPARALVAEMWLYPDGARILELSTKCAPTDALTVGAELRAYLTGQGIDIGGAQQTKTKTALEFYAGQLADEAAAEAATGA